MTNSGKWDEFIHAPLCSLTPPVYHISTRVISTDRVVSPNPRSKLLCIDNDALFISNNHFQYDYRLYTVYEYKVPSVLFLTRRMLLPAVLTIKNSYLYRIVFNIIIEIEVRYVCTFDPGPNLRFSWKQTHNERNG